MKHWQPHSQVAANPPFQRARDVHQLHFAQSVPTIHAEDSALRRNMPQHNNENEEAPLAQTQHTDEPYFVRDKLPRSRHLGERVDAVRSLGPAKELPFKHRLTFAPAAAVWGQMDRSWTDVARTSRTAETITTADYVALFCQSCCQYLGYTDPVLAPIAQNSAGAGHAFTTVITSTIAIATAGIGTSLTSIWGRRCCVSFALSAIPPAEECAHQ